MYNMDTWYYIYMLYICILYSVCIVYAELRLYALCTNVQVLIARKSEKINLRGHKPIIYIFSSLVSTKFG